MGGGPLPIEIKSDLKKKRAPRAVFIRRFFSKEGVHPYDEVGWQNVEVPIHDPNGSVNVRRLEFPDFWSENAINIAGSKYFRGRIGSTERETSVRQMIDRVTSTLTDWGLKFGHLKTAEEA